MAKELGIFVGKKVMVFGFKSGITNSGKYQLFNWTEKVKDATGTYVPTQKYTFFVTNDEELVINNGQEVEIVSIEKITPSWNSYKKPSGEQVRERIIGVSCKIKFAGQAQNQETTNAKETKTSNDPFGDDNNNNSDNPFANMSDDDFDFN